MSAITTSTTMTTPMTTRQTTPRPARQTAGPGAAAAETVRPAAHSTVTPPAPSIHRRLLLTWLAVYPTITVVQLFLGTSVARFALPVRTLIVTALVAPVVVYLVLPQILKIDRRFARAWANRGR